MVAPRGISDTRGLTNLKIGSDLGRLVMSHTAKKLLYTLVIMYVKIK